MSEILMSARVLKPDDIDQELVRLAETYKRTQGPGLRFLSFVGAQADQLLTQLPDPVRRNLDTATEQALMLAVRQSGSEPSRSGRRLLPQISPRGERLVSAALGAVGGAGGVAGTLAELPLTTAFLLRTIQAEAARMGFDPANESVQFDSIRLFAAPGPFAPQGGDTGLLAARLGLSTGGVKALVSQVAPKLGVALGQKLAAQAVPVLGGAAGASCNYLYAGYYQNVAKIHYSLRRLAIDCDMPEGELMDLLQQKLDHQG